MLAPGRPLSAVQAVMSRWQLEIGHGGRVHTLKIRKHCKLGQVGGSLGAFMRQEPHSRFSRGSWLCKRAIVTCKDNHTGAEGALPEGRSCWVQTLLEKVWFHQDGRHSQDQAGRAGLGWPGKQQGTPGSARSPRRRGGGRGSCQASGRRCGGVLVTVLRGLQMASPCELAEGERSGPDADPPAPWILQEALH